MKAGFPRSMVAAALASAALLAPSAPALAEQYVNPRFGTSVTYPETVFTQRLRPSDNGDGQSWHAPDGGTLLVLGANNVEGYTPGTLVEAYKKFDRKTTYTATGSNWAVLSGYEGGAIFYERYRFGRSGVIHAVVISYPTDLKRKYDPLVGPIASSLSGP